jgi:ketosteroid isomerase-like protein
MRSEEHKELVDVVRAWDEAMVANDTAAIGRFMTDDWIIVGPDGSIEGRERFLSLIASGELTHDTMTSEDLVIRVLGDSAIVMARGVSAGVYRGSRFRELERSSNVFARRDGRWVCVHTHLSKLLSG